ncbi:hypothetical protein [Campylobacter sp.]|uniref:hypothetical protein n=1 Tax=Campylobacter sp. TaxID=205 RepID=UPI002A754071|nr:hypothetical protein [Campylobacter sp.]MDY3245473.1 hypothetical protein [Campylobacter sp.]
MKRAIFNTHSTPALVPRKMAEIAGTSNFASEIATLSISIFSNTEAKYSKKIAKFAKKKLIFFVKGVKNENYIWEKGEK